MWICQINSKGLISWVLLATMVVGISKVSDAQANRFKITQNKEESRIDITVDGRPFTSYIYPDSLMKPVLYPILSADGKFITRGWPIKPREGESADHPHHIGLWFNYENVDGLDFWNNSCSIAQDRKNRYGTIRHFSVDKTAVNNKNAELWVTAFWERPDGVKLLKQNTHYIFSGNGRMLSIEMIVKLTALQKDVSFPDIKDGLIGLRLTRELEQPSNIPVKVTDARGAVSEVKKTNLDVATGTYRSSKGIMGDAVWGTRGRWVKLDGEIDGDPVSVVMLDHSMNVGYPTYWHARGYGLFAANPLGQKIFSNGKEEMDFKLKAGTTVIFKYKLLINSGSHLSDDQVNIEARNFAMDSL